MMFKKSLRLGLSLFLLHGSGTGFADTPNASNAPAKASPTDTHDANSILFNFQDTDIQAVVKTMSQITGRNFLLDQRVKGKVTIISSKPVSAEAAYQLFISALKAQGFATVEGPGGAIQIVPEMEAKGGASVRSGLSAANSDQWVTQIIPIQNASASQLATLFKPLIEPNGILAVYPGANTLVVTAPGASVRNLLHVVDRLDQPGSNDITIVPLENASAGDVAQLVSRMSQTASSSEASLSIIPDMRTNSVLIRADSPARAESLRQLVVKLDVPAKSGGQSRVIYLHHADATKLADVLRGVLGGQKFNGANSGTGSAGASSAIASPTDAYVQADEASNALIINAPDAVYSNLYRIIDRLDIARAQVFVEGMIAEVTADRAAQFGIQWNGAEAAAKGAIGGALNFPLFGGALTPANALTNSNGLTVGYVGQSFTLPDGTVVSGLSGFATALAQDSNVNILSTPDLVTLDNSEASIIVGQNVPFLTGKFSEASGTGSNGVNPFETIERHDVGLTLKIKPQISEGGEIKLQIYQEVSSVVPTTTAGAQDLITNKRALETTVSVQDGHIIVLGGLIQDSVSENINRVPVLSSIPLIGWLFKYRSRSKNKINLMVFLRPVIVRTSDDLAGLTYDRYETIRARQRETRMERSPVVPRYPVPELPQWNATTSVSTPTVSTGRP